MDAPLRTVGQPLFNLYLQPTAEHEAVGFYLRGTRQERLARVSDRLHETARAFAAAHLLGERHVTDEGYLLPGTYSRIGKEAGTIELSPQLGELLNLEKRLHGIATPRPIISGSERLLDDAAADVARVHIHYAGGKMSLVLVKDGLLFLDTFPDGYEGRRRTPYSALDALAERAKIVHAK